MDERSISIRKPTIQMSLWAAESPQHRDSSALADILHELRGLRAEQRGVCGAAKAEQDIVEDFHQLSFNGQSWRIVAANGQGEFWLENLVGLQHISTLLQSPTQRFTPMFLAQTNGRRPKRAGASSDRLSSEEMADCASRLSVRDSLDWDDTVIDHQCDYELRREYKRIQKELMHAYEAEDGEVVRRLEPDFFALMKQFHVDHDVRGRVRLFEKRHWNRSRGNVTNAISRALVEIAARLEVIAEQLDVQIDRKGGFAYRPIDGLPAWNVSTMEVK